MGVTSTGACSALIWEEAGTVGVLRMIELDDGRTELVVCTLRHAHLYRTTVEGAWRTCSAVGSSGTCEVERPSS